MISGLKLAVVENVLQPILKCSVLRKESSKWQQRLGGIIIIIIGSMGIGYPTDAVR